MSSLSFLVHVPSISATHSSRISIAKHHKLRAMKTGNASNKNRKDQFPERLKRELMPKHVAIFQDGNRRWGTKRGLSATSGYEAGTIAIMEIVKLCARWGIPVVSVFVSHIRNQNRPKEEFSHVINLLERGTSWGLPIFQSEGVKFSLIGDTSEFPTSLLNAKNQVVDATKHNSRTHFICAINYTGSYDILQACKSISQKVKDGTIQPEDINEKLMGQELETRCAAEFPEPDLMIRTGGHKRLSDFYLWQMAYTELYFSDVLWPDFGKNEFVEALASFQERNRGYGRSYV